MKLNNIFLLFKTLYYLKVKQIIYRLYYSFREKLRKFQSFQYSQQLSSFTNDIFLETSISSIESYRKNEFIFLNILYSFNNKINWNYSEYGKLWTYNLTYFDYLNQKEMSKVDGLKLIRDFVDQSQSIQDGYMPFPISLRGINWIKFLSKHKIKDQKINDSLYTQYFILMDNIEYHILGNHLLENGFSLLLGSYYYQDEKLYVKAKEILTSELEEQILHDGGHFELSPMYHQIMLFRVLDSINLVQNNNWKSQELLELLTSKAEIMLGWLNAMTYENGSFPLFNDSTNNIAPTTKELNEYAYSLRIKTKKIKLNDSGYRKIKKESYEMAIDIGNIGPDYIPGHAHSDTFNFELYVRNEPVIVDTGLSTYEANARRQLERSTISHNTVEINGQNQSEVWGGFRVARRAKVVGLKEDNNSIEATHDGYKNIGVLHTRKFTTQEEQITIRDSLTKKECLCMAYFHFHPNVHTRIVGTRLVNNYLTLSFLEPIHIELIEYDYAPAFNTKIKAQCAKITFQDELITEIIINKKSK